VAGTNPRTGSPIKVRKRNQVKTPAFSLLTGSSSTSSNKNPVTKCKKKSEKNEMGSLMCQGRSISLPVPTVFKDPSPSIEPSQFRATSTSTNISTVGVVENATGMADIDAPDIGVDVEFDGSDPHHSVWLRQLPKFDGGQRERKRQAWPHWRNDVLRTILPSFLEVEEKIFQRLSLPIPPSPLHSIANPTCEYCQQTLTSGVVQCVERTGM
jgi:hypothetical protein